MLIEIFMVIMVLGYLYTPFSVSNYLLFCFVFVLFCFIFSVCLFVYCLSFRLGGSPYPLLSNAELMKRLKDGYRMEKPDLCSDHV